MKREALRAEVRRGFKSVGGVRKFALLLLAALGLASGARAGSLLIDHYIESTPEKQEFKALASTEIYAISRYGYDVNSITQIPFPSGTCKWTYSENTVIFSSVNGDCAVNVVWKPWVYTMRYDSNGGDWNSKFSTEVSTNFAVTIKAYDSSSCSKVGNTLQGWNTKQDGSGDTIALSQNLTMGTPPISNDTRTVTLYAQWQANQYPLHLIPGTGIDKIYYKVNGATEWTATSEKKDVQVYYGTEWSVYAVPKAGYSYSATSETNPKTGKMGVEGASFEPNASAGSISLSFNGNGSTEGSMNDQTFTVDEGKYLSQNLFSRGYQVTFDAQGGSACSSQTATYPFKNWNNEADGSGAYTYTDQQMVTNPCGSTGEAKMLYAQWDTTKIAPVTLPATSKAGSSFSGWYSDFACSPQSKVGDAGASYTPTTDTTLYAGWNKVVYTVTFYDDDPADDGKEISQQQIEYGQSAVEPARPVKEYYKFSAWNTEEWRMVTKSLQVWPHWEGKVYQVVYNSNYVNGQKEKSIPGDSCGPNETAKKITLDDATTYNMEKTGYAFSGWETNNQAKVKKWAAGIGLHFSALDEIGGGSEKVNFYAIWSPNSYKVHFDGGGATGGSMYDQDFTYDQAQELTANGFTREGQDFLHWHDAKNNADYIDGQVVSNLTATAGDTITLTAVWSNYHYVRFDRNGATNETEMAPQTFLGAETNALSPNAYGKIGYTFAGWATNAVSATNLVVTYTNCQAASFPGATAGMTNILYAVWATNHYTIAFDPGTDLKSPYFFGTMEPLMNCAYDTPITIKCGYTNYCSLGLLGWSKTKGATVPEYLITTTSPITQGGDAVVSNLTDVADGTATLYAVWADEGELSKAAGLKNAVLASECINGNLEVRWQAVTDYTEEPGHPVCVALTSPKATPEEGIWNLTMKTVGPGTISYCWYWEQYGTGVTQFRLYVNDELKATLASDVYWTQTNRVEIVGEGEHVILWKIDGTINDGIDQDKICLDDIVWMPGITLKPGEEMPTYDSQEAAEAAAKAAKVARPNAEVEAVVSADDYNAMFDVKAVPVVAANDGDWTLAIQLKPAVSNEVQSVLNEAETNLCSVITQNPISATFVMKPGLYYALAGTNEVEWLSLAVPANWVLGTGAADGQTVEATRPTDAVAYYYELRMAILPWGK